MIAKRTNVAKEILSTEKQYVQNLRNLVAGFLQPLRENAKSETPLLTEENLKSIFSDIEVILGYHSLLEKELDKRISAWSQSVKLGDIFLKIASFLKTYNQYIQHYKKANLLLADLNKNTEFAAMMEKLRFSPTCGGKGIKDFLIMPVQRIPRYSMLLQDMMKNTWAHHADYASLSAALKTILELASYVEEQQGENANVIKVLEVQNLLSGKVIEGTKLVQPSRRYVRESAATKHERDGKQSPVHLFLFNDILIWAKPKKTDTHEVIKLDSLITLIVKDAEMGVLDPPNHAKAMGIVTPQGASTVILASADEKKQWQTDLRKFIKESNDKYNAVKKREGGEAGPDAMMDILNYQKVTPAAVHGTKKDEGSAIAREVNAFSDKIKSGFTSVLSRASGGRKDDETEERQRSTSLSKPNNASPRTRPGSMITVAPKDAPTPVKSPRSNTITSTLSSSSLPGTPPKLSASNRSLSLVTPKSEKSDMPSPTTPQRNAAHSAAETTSNAAPSTPAPPTTPGPALLPTPSPAPATPASAVPDSPSLSNRTAESSPRRPSTKEKKEKTKRGTLDTSVDVSPRKERHHHRSSKKDGSERPSGYSTLRAEKTSPVLATSLVPPGPATTDSVPPRSPKSLALDADTQAKLARLKDENEEAARRLKKMQEKFGAVVEQK